MGDREEKREKWAASTKADIRTALNEVRFGKLGDRSFVKFRMADNAVVVNSEHPFVAEYSKSKDEKELVRTIAMVSLLSDVFALNAGVPAHLLEEIRDYRDRLMRHRALASRRSGPHIAQILLRAQRGEVSKELEEAVSAALSYLGFVVTDMAKSGQPEGSASAFAIPLGIEDTPLEAPPLYKVAFDAKSTKGRQAAKTKNVGVSGIVRHRAKYEADYTPSSPRDHALQALAELEDELIRLLARRVAASIRRPDQPALASKDNENRA